MIDQQPALLPLTAFESLVGLHEISCCSMFCLSSSADACTGVTSCWTVLLSARCLFTTRLQSPSTADLTLQPLRKSTVCILTTDNKCRYARSDRKFITSLAHRLIKFTSTHTNVSRIYPLTAASNRRGGLKLW